MSQLQRSWSMHPALSSDIASILSEHDIPFRFHTADEPAKAINFGVVNISGTFVCKVSSCQRTTQKHDDITAVVREYPKSLYSVKVFHQLCHYCNRLNKPVLDATYGTRIALHIMSWKKSEIKPDKTSINSANKLEEKDEPSMPTNAKSIQVKSVKKFSMYPELHRQVQALLNDVNIRYSFYQRDDDSKCIDSHNTNVCGVFKCNSKTCKGREWNSGIITTIIRRYPNDSYNARVYHQHCQRCEYVCRPKLDSSYLERVSRRLKIWSGVYVEAILYDFKATSPHDETRCEGCLHGLCRMSNTLLKY